MSLLRPLKPRFPAGASLPDALRDFDPLLARLYAARGVTDPQQLDYGLHRLVPVGSLAGIDDAVRLLLANRDRRIIVIGDFDADGATSTALVLRCLRDFGFADSGYLVPNRFDFGYGLTPEIVRVAAARSPQLLVTVDNGVSSVEGVAEASRLGIEVLITDHHLPGPALPQAAAMVNPNLEGSTFASPNLAGVGVAFYLMAALGRVLERDHGRTGAARIAARYLDLVALGTVADVVRLDHNNRILVQQGLARIRAGRTITGINALLQVAGRSPLRAVSTDLGFAVGPRLNAAGRLDDISVGIECLLTDDISEARRLAGVLDSINKERREIEAGMRRQAFDYVDALQTHRLPPCICLHDPGWHHGIVGLIAAGVRERYHRPAIAFAPDDNGCLKGSARSVPGVHIRDLIEAVAASEPGLVGRFGGHAMAAGLTIDEPQLPRFSRAVAAQFERLYPEADFSGAILTDGPLPAVSMNLEGARRLRDAGPWGAGFPEPVFIGDFAIREQRVVGEKHLKLKLDAGGGPIDAIAFNQAGPAYRGSVRLAYRLDVNEYRGIESPQLVVEQIASLS